MAAQVVTANNIAIDEFKHQLELYPASIRASSDAKGAKGGQKTLHELDEYRYNDALKAFGSEKSSLVMKLDDIKTLVEWKLRYGKFRPTLMKLVSSNDPDTAEDIVKEALVVYRKDGNIQAALDVLTKLKGIGPATASLLLAVHDPTRVIFFSDQAFWWLCCDGKISPIKYNAKEYQALCSKVDDLRDRLGVPASDVEKVACVLMNTGDARKPVDYSTSRQTKKRTAPSPKGATKKSAASSLKDVKNSTRPLQKDSAKSTSSSQTKRKPDSDTAKAENETHDGPSLRRSKPPPTYDPWQWKAIVPEPHCPGSSGKALSNWQLIFVDATFDARNAPFFILGGLSKEDCPMGQEWSRYLKTALRPVIAMNNRRITAPTEELPHKE
ncbi:hypothetical protein ACJZ2D_009876 [Fusarium nematophilum]